MNPLLERISIDPRICGGKPCINGTRIWVSLILDLLASGMPPAEILEQYPGLNHADILACIAYGSEMSRVTATISVSCPALGSAGRQRISVHT